MYSFNDSNNYRLDNYESAQIGNRFKVLGKGVVSVKPDAAEVVIGVVTENVQLEVAQDENARVTEKVINSIKELGVLQRFIQTQSYNIRANYDYVDGKQVFRGYEVNNSLKVLIKDISFAGEIIDTAVKNGANSISGINFIVIDEKRHYYEALSLALEDAQNKAAIMASKLGVSLNVIPIEINEKSSSTITPLGVTEFKMIAGATPIEKGENKIIADLEAIFIYR